MENKIDTKLLEDIVTILEDHKTKLSYLHLRGDLYVLFFMSAISSLFGGMNIFAGSQVSEAFIKAWKKNIRSGINDGMNVINANPEEPKSYDTEDLRIMITQIRKEIEDNIEKMFPKEKE